MIENRFDNPFEREFWTMIVNQHITKSNPNQCWLWHGPKNNGYGLVRRGGENYRNIVAHRLVYELEIGPIPKGCRVIQTCGRRDCCNPAHFVTQKPSIRRIRWIPVDKTEE